MTKLIFKLLCAAAPLALAAMPLFAAESVPNGKPEDVGFLDASGWGGSRKPSSGTSTAVTFLAP